VVENGTHEWYISIEGAENQADVEQASDVGQLNAALMTLNL
jgi:hypothetical protein